MSVMLAVFLIGLRLAVRWKAKTFRSKGFGVRWPAGFLSKKEGLMPLFRDRSSKNLFFRDKSPISSDFGNA